MNNDERKVALVTGGRSGIGLACTEKLQSAGYRVFTAQRSVDEKNESIVCDFTDSTATDGLVAQVIQQTGRLDCLVNNAGIMHEGTVTDIGLKQWQQTLQVNLTAPFQLIKHAMPYLVKAKGSIVNIGSIEGLGSNPGHPAYCASKAGLHGLTRAVAVDHGADGVRCNAVAPGWINTELNEAFINGFPDPQAFRQNIGKIHPVGRTGMPEEVASLVVWLLSDEAQFVTGQVWTIDGGRMAQLSLPQ